MNIKQEIIDIEPTDGDHYSGSPTDFEEEGIVDVVIKSESESEYQDNERCTDVFIKEEISIDGNHCDLTVPQAEGDPIAKKELKDELNNQRSTKSNERFPCEICAKDFPSRARLHEHFVVHTGERPFKCEKCGKGFKFRRNLTEHLIIHTDDGPYTCEYCGKVVKRRSILRIHRKKYHLLFVCDFCPKHFATQNELDDHVLLHEEKPVDEKDQVKPNQAYGKFSQGSENSTEDPFVCHICFKEFRMKGWLTNHLAIHREDKPFKCEVCSKGFKFKAVLRNHMLSHKADKPFSCGTCCKVFKSEGYLKQHAKYCGFNNKGLKTEYKCKVCHKIFDNRLLLKKHFASHKDVKKPHVCELCHQSFKQSVTLAKHIASHGDEGPYECKDCGKVFKIKGYLHNHKRFCIKGSYSDGCYRCDICDRNFATLFLMKRHLIVHSEDRPFSCEICHKSYKMKCLLTNHMRTHNEEGNFPCEVCERKFTRKCYLVQHRKSCVENVKSCEEQFGCEAVITVDP